MTALLDDNYIGFEVVIKNKNKNNNNTSLQFTFDMICYLERFTESID